MSVTFYAINHNNLVDTQEADAYALNMSNTNSGRMLRTLGLYDEEVYLCGTLAGEAFLKHVAAAAESLWRDEYTTERLVQLAELARFCADHGYDVAWA